MDLSGPEVDLRLVDEVVGLLVMILYLLREIARRS